jgi:penicillin-insensitive murein endopeptidase
VGSPECEAQAPLPPGDGCDATLAWWRQQKPPAPLPAAAAPHPPPSPKLPASCAAILAAPGS